MLDGGGCCGWCWNGRGCMLELKLQAWYTVARDGIGREAGCGGSWSFVFASKMEHETSPAMSVWSWSGEA
eukprot:7891852-Prorocentrum_lima.AAC.1